MRISLSIIKLLLASLIALGSASSPVVFAANTQVLVNQVQVRKISASDLLSHLHEAIVIKNDSEDDVDVSNWCIYYASVAANFTDGSKRKLACFEPASPNAKYYIKAGGVARIGSFEPAFANPEIFNFPSFSQGLGNDKGKVLLVEGQVEHDRVEWGTHPGALNLKGEAAFGRRANQQGVLTYSGVTSDDFTVIPYIDLEAPLGTYQIEDNCPLLEGFQEPGEECGRMDDEDEAANKEEDEKNESIQNGNGTTNTPPLLAPTAPPAIQIVEFLANPKGLDGGNEFIELYNFGNNVESLSGVKLIIENGTGSSRKEYALPSLHIYPGQYLALYNINNLNFSLNNTAGKISLYFNETLFDEVSYTSTKEGLSWALVDGNFILTTPSPNSNNTSSQLAVISTTPKPVAIKACGPGQERNPATGRCRKVPIKPTPQPCKPGSVRNPQTGRCRKIPVPKVPKPCKAGQERNPQTGRCRNIKLATPPKVGDGVKILAVPETATGWVWLGVAGVVVSGVFYALWEWRSEIKKLFSKRKN